MRDVPFELRDYVSRETLEKFDLYISLVHKWNQKINLVAPSQTANIWSRHIWDCAQIWPHIIYSGNHLDLGSGGGFPGLVLSILAKDSADFMKVTLVESDARKVIFLRTVIRELELDAIVKNIRYETLEEQNASTLSARALAPLKILLNAASLHLSFTGVAIFLKGERWVQEVETANNHWSFQLESFPSITNSKAALLKIRDINRV